MSTVRLRVPENELNIMKSYAKHNHVSLSKIIRTTSFDVSKKNMI